MPSNAPIPASASWALALHRFNIRYRHLRRRLVTRWYYQRLFGSMGPDCIVGRHSFVGHPERFFLGTRIQIRDGARLEAVTEYQGRQYDPIVSIGNDCTFEQGLHLVCGERITFGCKVAVTEYVGIFDIWHPYDDPTIPIVDHPIRTAPVSIGDHSLIGMGAVVQPGVTIGRHCLIGANAVVTKNIPDFSIAVGQPARVIRRFDPHSGRWVREPEAPVHPVDS